MLVNVYDCLGSESIVMPVKQRSCCNLWLLFSLLFCHYLYNVFYLYTFSYMNLCLVYRIVRSLFPTRINGSGPAAQTIGGHLRVRAPGFWSSTPRYWVRPWGLSCCCEWTCTKQTPNIPSTKYQVPLLLLRSYQSVGPVLRLCLWIFCNWICFYSEE